MMGRSTKVEKLVFLMAIVIIKFKELFEDTGLRIVIFSKDPCNYLRLIIYAPHLQASTRMDWISSERVEELTLSFDTCLFFSKSDIYKTFTIKLLGFGFNIARQTGY
jgi:hypothetical protein